MQTSVKKYYSIKEVAEMLSIHYNTVVALIKDRAITAVKIGHGWRISQQSFDEYIEKRTVKAK